MKRVECRTPHRPRPCPFASPLRWQDTDRAGRATTTFLDNDPENAEFWDALGGYEEVGARGGFALPN